MTSPRLTLSETYSVKLSDEQIRVVMLALWTYIDALDGHGLRTRIDEMEGKR